MLMFMSFNLVEHPTPNKHKCIQWINNKVANEDDNINTMKLKKEGEAQRSA